MTDADRDPPLPAGTEVVTRVDRTVDDRTVAAGALGRVVAVLADDVDVDIVGVGRVRYRRGEVEPRKRALARYARHRGDPWPALSPCIVLDAVVGSRAWGLAEASSDTDRRGVFVLPLSWTTGLIDPPVDLASPDGTGAYWEIGKAIRQGLRADPSTLETLFAGDASAVRDEMGAWLLEARDAFVSIEIYGSFGRYAVGQLDRLERSPRRAPDEPPPKNAYNLIRLLDLAIRWLTAGGAPELRVRDELRPTLLAIKRGEVPLADVVAMARGMIPQLETARTASALPRQADLARAEAVLRRIRREAARRSVAEVPGPWGASSPPPPDARFDD